MDYRLVNMKIILAFFISLLSFLSFSQENWISIDTHNKVENDNFNDIIPIVNKENGDLAVFLKEKKGLVGYLYNNKQELVHSIVVDELPKKSQVFIGSTFKDKSFSLCFSNPQKTRFSYLNVNFETQRSNFIENLKLDIKREKIIEFMEFKNQLFLLTVQKHTSILKLHTFNLQGSVSTNTFDLSKEVFKSENGYEYDLYSLLYGNTMYSSFESVDYDVPNSLEIASAFTKLYHKNGKIILTNNLYNKYTYIVELDIEKLNYELNIIENKNYEKQLIGVNSNSYIFNDLFFNIYSTNKKLDLNIYDLKTHTLLKEFNINKEDSISFKNTPIIQEGGDFDNYRELEKTSKFLRKVTNSKIGVTAYKDNNNLVLTLGASEKIKSGNFAIVGGAFGGLVGALVFSTFDSYTKTKSTRIVCLLNNNLNHIGGNVPLNGFDKIQDYIEVNKLQNSKIQTVFKYNEKYIWGSFNEDSGMYDLLLF